METDSDFVIARVKIFSERNFFMKLNEIHIRDPFVLTAGGQYYMYGSTGTNKFYVLKSPDLNEWSGPEPCFEPAENFWGKYDFWAPEVHFYKGKYYMLASFKADGVHRGTQILVSQRPEGPFSPNSDKAVTPADWECLDGTLYISPDGDPYMVFCHEWTQVGDGEVCAVKLSQDLKHPLSEPRLLFKASSLPGAADINGDGGIRGKVTDGPYLYNAADGKLIMIWSTFNKNGYVQAQAISRGLFGEWDHSAPLILDSDGGHGMIFKTSDGREKLILHRPNLPPEERPVIFDIRYNGEYLEIGR